MEQLLVQLSTMLIYIAIGVYFRKEQKLPENAEVILSILVVSVMTPCTILSAFINKKADISVKTIIIVMGTAFLMFILLALIGKVSAKILKVPNDKKGLWEFMLIFSNNIFIGFPIIETMVGKGALIYASIICIPCNALIYSYGLYLIGKENDKYNFSLKEIINPCTLVSIVAVILLFKPVAIPEPLVNIVKTLGNMSTPIALIVLGMVIGNIFKLQMIKEKEIYCFCFLRLVIAPILIKLALSILGSKYVDIYKVLTITAALPVSNVSIILSEKYQNNEEMAAKYVTISTIFFVLLIPLFNFLKLF